MDKEGSNPVHNGLTSFGKVGEGKTEMCGRAFDKMKLNLSGIWAPDANVQKSKMLLLHIHFS